MSNRKWIGAGVAVLLLAGSALFLWPNGDATEPSAPVANGSEKAPIETSSGGETDAYVDKAPRSGLHTVYVELVDSDHTPIAGAAVEIVGAGFTRKSRTDVSGLAVVERVPSQVLRVTTVARGFAAGNFTAPLIPKNTPEVSWSFELVPSSAGAHASEHLAGVVVSGGQPVAGALVVVLREGVEAIAPADVQRTDHTGRFALPAPLEGAEVPVATTVLAFHRAHGAGEAPSGTSDIVIELPQGGFIEGTVVDDRGVPLPDFTIRAVPKAASEHKSLRALRNTLARLSRKERGTAPIRVLRLELDHLMRGKEQRFASRVEGKASGKAEDARPEDARPEDAERNRPGAFRFGPIASSKVQLVAAASGLEPGAVEVTVPEGATLDGVRIELSAAVVVTGVVTDGKTGAPIKGARVVARVRGERDGGFGSALTGKDGRYRLQTKAGKRHTLSASKRGYRPFDSGGVEGKAGEELVRDFSLRKASRDERRGHARDYVGVGAQLKQTEAGVLVQKVFEGGAAAEQLNEGDIIVRVEGDWVEDLSLRETVETILGDDGTEVELYVQRKGKPRGETERLVLERRRIENGGG